MKTCLTGGAAPAGVAVTAMAAVAANRGKRRMPAIVTRPLARGCRSCEPGANRIRAVNARQSERIVVLTMRFLAVSFAVVGILFIATPDGVLHRIDQLGDAIGDFSNAPRSQEKLWLGLAFAYMTVITGIALVVSTDVVRYRPFLLVLAAGKAASSLTTGAFYFFHDDVFIYLLNFIVDGSLVLTALGCWVLAGRVQEARAPV